MDFVFDANVSFVFVYCCPTLNMNVDFLQNVIQGLVEVLLEFSLPRTNYAMFLPL